MRSASKWFVVLAAAGCVGVVALVGSGACKSAESKAPAPAPGAAAGDDHIAVPGAPAPGGGSAEAAKVDPPGGPGAPAPGSAAPAVAGGSGAAQPADSGNTDSSFNVQIAPPAGAKAGAEAVTHIVVTPGKGYHVNQDYPIKLTLDPTPGVTIAKATMVKDDAQLSASKLAFDVKLTPDKPGSYKVAGLLKFAVCTESTCDPKKRPIAFELAAN